MDNFEYSIQLNDRDWAEFYLASEECNLIQPALAIAEEQLLSDLEDGEVEEGRLIRVRASPALAQSSAGHLPYQATDGHLLAEEIWSGSEDETDLGSVNRFLCKNRQLGTVCSQSCGSQENLLPHITLELPGSAECDILCAAEKRKSDIGDQPNFLSVVTTTRKEDFLGQNLKERLACTMNTNRDTSEKVNNPEGENGSKTLLLPHPKDDASQAATGDSQLPTLLEKTCVGGNPEFLGPGDVAGSPRSIHLSSLDSSKHQSVEHLETGMMTHQDTLMAKVVPHHKEPPGFHSQSVPALGILAPTDPLPKSHEEGAEKRSKAEKGITNLRGEGKVDPSEDFSCEVMKEECPLDQVVSPTSDMVRPEVKYLRPTATVDSTLDKHRDTASLTRGEGEKENSGESCSHPGVAVPLEEEFHGLAPGSHGDDFLQESIWCGPTLETSPESNVTVVTWPEMYDCFFCDDTQEWGGKMLERTGEESLGLNTSPDLPEMYGPEMYEYFFNEMGEVKTKRGSRVKGTKLEKISSSGQSAPPGDSEDPDSEPADSAMRISVPEVYEHFFVSGTNNKRTWRGIFLSMPALQAKKAARAFKSLVCKPAHLLKSQSQRQEPLLRRGSQGRLVLLSPRLLEETRPRAEDPTMAVMIPGTIWLHRRSWGFNCLLKIPDV